MHLIRRAAFRAVSSPSTSFISKPRSITTTSPFTLRSKTQSGISSTVLRRFASDDASEKKSSVDSADSEDHGAVRSAIESATESASTYAGQAAASLTENAERAKDTIVDGAEAAAAGLGFGQREERRPQREQRNDRDRRPERGFGSGRGDSRGVGGRERRESPVLTPNRSIYVGNLLFDVTPEDLTREFGEYGEVKKTSIASDGRGLSKGFGYVEFATTEQATAAIEAKHQTVYEGRRLVVNYQAETRREAGTVNPPSKTLFIGNLAFEMSDADLNKLFRDIRNVIDVRVAIDRRTGQPRGFAHADFVDTESAVKGYEELKDKEFFGRRLRVDYSAGTSARDGGRGGSGNRDGGERRERSEF